MESLRRFADRPAPPFHEPVMGALLVFLISRAALALGPTDPAVWTPLCLLLAGIAIVVWDRRSPSQESGLARLLFHPLAVMLIYFRLGTDVPRISTAMADRALLDLDRTLFGETPSLLLKSIAHPALTEVLSLCYLLFYLGFVAYPWLWLATGPAVARVFYAGYFTVYAIGLTSYALVPARGPWLELAESIGTLDGGPLNALVQFTVRHGCNGVDVFPSLHVALAVYVVGFDLLAGQRRRFLLSVAPAAGLCFSTVYLGYHYGVDLLAGVALGLAGLAVVAPIRPQRLIQPPPSTRSPS